MVSRACFLPLLVAALVSVGASVATGDPAPRVSSYFLARADARLCPSPACGGLWVTLVNAPGTRCGDGEVRTTCYAAEADLSRLSVREKDRGRLQRLIVAGRAVARGRLVGGRLPGFPELDVLVVSEVWTESSSLARPRGVFRRLSDTGIRCVTVPCFWIGAAVLNTSRRVNVSDVDLGRAGAREREERRALRAIPAAGLIAAGRIVREPNAGPAGTGRTFVATQFYVPAAAAKG
ncbi:MAG: DUF6748 domain-containing protein [Gaiellaceae bacterium]